MEVTFVVLKTSKSVVIKKKIRPTQDLNPLPLRYRCSALATELKSQLGADHYVGSK